MLHTRHELISSSLASVTQRNVRPGMTGYERGGNVFYVLIELVWDKERSPLLHTRQLASFYRSQRMAFTLRGKRTIGIYQRKPQKTYKQQQQEFFFFYKSLHMDTKGEKKKKRKSPDLRAFGGYIGLPSSVVFLNCLISPASVLL